MASSESELELVGSELVDLSFHSDSRVSELVLMACTGTVEVPNMSSCLPVEGGIQMGEGQREGASAAGESRTKLGAH